jgi:hypothetical protein
MACRLKAINTILKNPLSTEKFDIYCDMFDIEMKNNVGISRLYFYCGENMENIFSYILQKHNINSLYIPLFENSTKNLLKILEQYINVRYIIAFNLKHAFCLIKKNNKWFNNKKLLNKFPTNCGFIVII